MNLPTQDTCFQNWLASQTDDDLRQALGADVGGMIRDRLRTEINRRGLAAKIIPFSEIDIGTLPSET